MYEGIKRIIWHTQQLINLQLILILNFITGNGSTQNITGVGFQPDFVWIKNRSTTNHDLTDVLEVILKRLSHKFNN